MPAAHGSRRSYACGCRCLRCRVANAEYARLHRQPTGTVPADAARAHVQQLAALGLGARRIAALTGLSRNLIDRVRLGQQTTLRPSTAARLLTAAPVLAPGALVPGTTSWRFLDCLHREGYTRRELAWHLGHKSQQLQLLTKPRKRRTHAKARIRQTSALRIAHLYERLAET